MTIHRRFVETNEAQLYVETAGSGFPLVLVHGFSLDTRMWDDQFEYLAQHYHVIRYDSRRCAGGQRDLAYSPVFSQALRQPLVAARLRQNIADYSGWHLMNADRGRGIEPPAIHRFSQGLMKGRSSFPYLPGHMESDSVGRSRARQPSAATSGMHSCRVTPANRAASGPFLYALPACRHSGRL
jgi:hypothetical protein